MPADLVQAGLYALLLVVIAVPLGAYIARVFAGELSFLAPVERALLGAAGVGGEQRWTRYASALLILNGLGFLLLFALLTMQHLLPLNPQGFGGLSWHLAFNTAISFVTNTNWQSYGGETTLSHFSQMVGLTTQNFLSAATGMAVAAAVLRGFATRQGRTVFDLFHRAARGDGAPAGTGMGLAIWKGLVEAHGGNVRAEAGPEGQGTRIVMTPPREQPGSVAE